MTTAVLILFIVLAAIVLGGFVHPLFWLILVLVLVAVLL